MPVILERRNFRTAPVIVCEICGQRIEDASMGMAVWFSETIKDDDFSPRFAHKGVCLETLDPDNQGQSTELTLFLKRLLVNSGMAIGDDKDLAMLESLT